MNGYRFSVLIRRNPGDGWTASCTEYPGCEAKGESREDVLAAIGEAIRIRIEDGLGDDEPVPEPLEIAFTALSLNV